MISKEEKRKRDKQIEAIVRARGIERQNHFANGGSLVDWRGGTNTVTVDRKKKQNKQACRGKWNG